MPRYVKPVGLPPEVEAIIDVIGNRVRESLVHELARRGACTTAELQQAVDARRDAVVRHLRALEDASIVQADTPRADRAGRTPTWSLNRRVVEDHLDQLRTYLLGN